MTSRRTRFRDGTDPVTATAFGRARRALPAVAAAVAFALLAACGGSESESPGNSQSAGATSGSSSAAAPEDLAEEVAQHYFDALDELDAILSQDPQIDDLRLEVLNLKNEYITLLLPYGYSREEMSGTARDAFDSAINRAILLSTPPALTTLGTTVADLNAAGETSLASEVASFNILTQYVFFDLLKEQDPDEAERLGIP